MSRRENRKKELNLKLIVTLICFIVVIVTFVMLHDLRKKADKIKAENNVYENVVLNNTVEESITNNVIEEIDNENTVNNVVTNNVVVNTTNTNKNNVNNKTNSPVNKNAGAGITDKKQQAIELVKNEWGEDNSVDFVFDYVNEKGEYVIAVRNRDSAVVESYYRVNLENKTVELD